MVGWVVLHRLDRIGLDRVVVVCLLVLRLGFLAMELRRRRWVVTALVVGEQGS